MGYFSRLYNPDSFANFFLVIESACIEPENPIGDFHSSSINEQRLFKIVLKRSPTVDFVNYGRRPSKSARDPT